MTTESTIFYQMSEWERFLFTAIPILAVLGLLASVGLACYRSAQTSKQWRQDQAAAPTCIRATVLSKQTEAIQPPRKKQLAHDARTAVRHSASFAPMDDAPPLAFFIPIQAWTALCEGSMGQLCFQGQRFLRFTVEESDKSTRKGGAL